MAMIIALAAARHPVISDSALWQVGVGVRSYCVGWWGSGESISYQLTNRKEACVLWLIHYLGSSPGLICTLWGSPCTSPWPEVLGRSEGRVSSVY